tara:strand:+ start:953 stop:1219 length:267 start_codon:yes stop_codon:yes gene_type:complete
MAPILITTGSDKGKTVWHLINRDPYYCNWLSNQSRFKDKRDLIFKYMIDHGIGLHMVYDDENPNYQEPQECLYHKKPKNCYTDDYLKT